MEKMHWPCRAQLKPKLGIMKNDSTHCCLIIGMFTQLAAATATKGTQRATRGGAFWRDSNYQHSDFNYHALRRFSSSYNLLIKLLRNKQVELRDTHLFVPLNATSTFV